MLFGESDAVTGFQVAENIAETPETHFEIDPRALFAALKAERAGKARLLGYWHSHPSGDATPSLTDASMAAPDGKLWVIVAGEAITVWLAGETGLHGRFEALTIEPE